MKRMDISDELKISVYHEGILLFLSYSSFEHVIPIITENKRAKTLIRQITELSDDELRDEYPIKTIQISGTSSWSAFLQELTIICRRYKENHGLVLGAIIEIMDELNWQEDFNIRRFLSLFLNSEEELAHLKIATVGTEHSYIEQWRYSIIEEAKGYASYKSKII